MTADQLVRAQAYIGRLMGYWDGPNPRLWYTAETFARDMNLVHPLIVRVFNDSRFSVFLDHVRFDRPRHLPPTDSSPEQIRGFDWEVESEWNRSSEPRGQTTGCGRIGHPFAQENRRRLRR